MKIVPVYVSDEPLKTDRKDRLISPADRPMLRKLIEQRGIRLGRTGDKRSSLERIISNSRVIIIEGISGSGKDTLQAYLKNRLRGRDVYDYSEGEVLHSWKQLQIEGIAKLRVEFMKLFVNYVRDIVSRDENAMFLLNRFHLSTYASTIVQQPDLESEYAAIIDVLRTLPVHILILHLDENDIARRSLHPERSSAWQKFQQQIVNRGSFRGRLEKQQQLILDAAKRQQIPYSVMKLSSEHEIRNKPANVSNGSSDRNRRQISAIRARISKRKHHLPPVL
jgi:thymidylate kinase